VRDGDETVAARAFEPPLVRTVGRKEVGVPHDGKPGCLKDLGKAFAEVPIREEDEAQAARS
jgi:hypothetical protein